MTTTEQLKELHDENKLMRTLGTRDGFFKYFFKQLGIRIDGKLKHRTDYECFNAINEKYYDLYGEYRYSSYNSFRRSYRHFIKRK